MSTQSSILAWRIPWTEEPGRLQSLGRKGSNMTEGLSTAQMQTTTYRMGKLKVVLCIVHGTIFNILGKTIKENNIKKNVCMCVCIHIHTYII